MNEVDYERLHHKTRRRGGGRFNTPPRATEYVLTTEKEAEEFHNRLTETDKKVLR